MKKVLSIGLLVFILLSACAPVGDKPAAAQSGIEIYTPMAVAAKTGEVSGAFLTIKNTGSEADRLVGAASDVAGATQVHETIMDGDVMKMQEVAAIEVPAGQTVELKRGGYHVMFLDLKQDLVAGQTITVTLKFEKAGEISVPVTVKSK